MAIFMPCKPIKFYATLHLSPIKCTVKLKAAGFTRIGVCEEVKPAAKDFTKCKDQIFISLKFSLDTCLVPPEKIQKYSKYPPITWKEWGEFCGR